MPAGAPWLTRDIFARSHFEFGSGTSLQPLLRFSDRSREFLFVDFELELDEVERHLLAGFEAIASGCLGPDGHTPLHLESLKRFEDLRIADFELASSPEATMLDVRRRLAASGFGMDEYFGYFSRALQGRAQRQWGVEAKVVRRLQHADGTVEVRPLTLRIVGGEGLLTYLGMGGARQPPASLGTVQTGWGELRNGPLASVLQGLAREGAPVPRIWIRGSFPGSRGRSAGSRLGPADPYSVLGQTYAHWVSDRIWPGAPGITREVRAWIREMPRTEHLHLGAHRIVATPLTPDMVRAAGAACLPGRLSEKLGVTDCASVLVAHSADGPLLPTLGATLATWERTRAFNAASDAVYVPFGYEDELTVVVRWLNQIRRPAITVHLPMPLDFEAAVLAQNEVR